MTHNVAILGASGYTGAETIRLIATHPSMKITKLCADRKAGQEMTSVFPHLRHLDLPVLGKIDDTDFSEVDLVFAALPHGPSQEIIKHLPRDLKIIDLSAGFRLRDPAAFEQWYGQPHAAPEMQAEAVYGLTEFYRDEIKDARLVAGTGCNAATGQFALRPLIAAGVIDIDEIIVDLKAASSGAGRSLKEHLLFSEMFENVKGYSLGSTHRHQSEFEQEFSKVAGRPVDIQITPHLIPGSRGIIITCYLRGDADAILETYNAAYQNEPFVQVLPMGEAPMMKDIRGSNFVHIGVVPERKPGRTTVIATLDNLTKGSSGQAVQNANLMLGEEETAGLMLAPLYP